MHNDAIFKQAQMIRNMVLGNLVDVTEETANHIPQGFRNHLLWQAGHILTSQEGMVLGLAGLPQQLPETYKALFGTGTKPEDWTIEPPTLGTVLAQLRDQPSRLKELLADKLDQPTAIPFKIKENALDTIGEVLIFSLFHEGMHASSAQALKRAIAAETGA